MKLTAAESLKMNDKHVKPKTDNNEKQLILIYDTFSVSSMPHRGN